MKSHPYFLFILCEKYTANIDDEYWMNVTYVNIISQEIIY